MNKLINATPQTSEERHQVFMLKKRIADTVLAEARIEENRNIHVKFRMDILKLAENRFESASKGRTKEIEKPFHASQIAAVA